MCGRYTIAKPKRIIAAFEPVTVKAGLDHPRYNIAPMQKVPVVRGARGARVLEDCQWGFIPSWAKDQADGSRMINARAETVAAKPAFRAAFLKTRCLIPADGFYEWQETESGKQPVYIHPADDEPFVFAGLYSAWTGAGPGTMLLSCTIVTKDADEFMAPIHRRMPVILPQEAWDAWTDPANADAAGLLRILAGAHGRQLTRLNVSKVVNSPANDDERCIRP